MAVRASNHRPPSAGHRVEHTYIGIGIGIGISCSLARKFTIAIKHLSLSLSASLLGRCPGLLVCSGQAQAQAYSQVLLVPTYLQYPSRASRNRDLTQHDHDVRPDSVWSHCIASHRIAGSLKNVFGLGLKIPARHGRVGASQTFTVQYAEDWHWHCQQLTRLATVRNRFLYVYRTVHRIQSIRSRRVISDHAMGFVC